MPPVLGASNPTTTSSSLTITGGFALEALEISGRVVDRHLQQDRCFPDLSDLLSVYSQNAPSLSGTSDMDYPLQGPGLLPNLPELTAVRRVPLPPELVEQFGRMLQQHIDYLLVLATSVDVVILGLSFPKGQPGLNDSMSGGMQLLPDPLYSIPTDNVYVQAIAATEQGRLFLAGRDGCLYEMAYQAEAGWFSQRCRKINHSKSSLSFLIPSVLQFSFSEDDPILQIAVDNSRNILYTRSEKGMLQAYDLGSNGQGMSRVASMCQNAIVNAAGNIAKTIDRSVFKPIVQISLSRVRLYFCTAPFALPPQKTAAQRPCTLALVHVRLPPGFSASSVLQKPAKVHKALYSKGVLLMAASETEDHDHLWCINHDSFPFKKPLMEAQMMSDVDGHSWALSAIDEERPSRVSTPLNRELIPLTDSPVVVQQHNIPQRKFVLLSTKGSHIFHKLRPVDQLRHLLVTCAGGESEEVERFFKLHRVRTHGPHDHAVDLV
ncbi:hypothetical protein CRUP_020634 [Coryphaenoides rupestris]|nr:hypothetical protein CRUP_020634 [Coryphaenoides rupestris]